MNETIEDLHRGSISDESRMKAKLEHRFQDLQRKFQEDSANVKDRYRREEMQLIELNERERKQESEASLEAIKRLRESEDKQVANILTTQQVMLFFSFNKKIIIIIIIIIYYYYYYYYYYCN